MDGNVDRVRTLLSGGTFSLEVTVTPSETPLVLASRQRGPVAVDIVELLLAHSAEKISKTIIFRMLMAACTWSTLDMVLHLVLLLPNFASTRTNQGENIFHAAVRNYSAGAEILSYFLKKYCLHKLLWNRNEDGQEPHTAFHRINCEILKIVVLNGSDFNGSRRQPSFAASCARRNFCPMRLAEKTLSFLNYEFDGEVLMELNFHETHNEMLGNVTHDVQSRLKDEFDLLKTKILYGTKTAYTFLLANRLECNSYAENVNFINQFLATQQMTFFGGLIRSKIIKSNGRLKLFEDSRESFAAVIKFHLPDLVFRKISIWLNNDGLRMIIRAEFEK